MTETRKKIIELIEPYMDKTLSEGCLISQKYKGKDIKNFYKISVIRDNYIQFNVKDFDYSSFDKKDVILGYDEYFEYEIIGHYDISAVLKFIEYNFKKPETPHKIEISDPNFHILQSGIPFNNEFPNKPLYLYSEKEDKNLLELLLYFLNLKRGVQ